MHAPLVSEQNYQEVLKYKEEQIRHVFDDI